jgi:hypothetical protein
MLFVAVPQDSDVYLLDSSLPCQTLLSEGFSVAICEYASDALKAGASSFIPFLGSTIEPSALEDP